MESPARASGALTSGLRGDSESKAAVDRIAAG